MEHRADFYIAPFAIDGELAGIAPLSMSALSPRWLGFCREFIGKNGKSFSCTIPQQSLRHISLQITSGDGATLATFSANGEIVSSAAALAGTNPMADTQVLRMFVESLRTAYLVGAASGSSEPFEQAFHIEERPLYIVVPWPNPTVSDTDHDLVRELNNHLAGALLASQTAA
jgi:hypothetical protein